MAICSFLLVQIRGQWPGTGEVSFIVFKPCCKAFHRTSLLQEADPVWVGRFGFDHWGSFPRGIWNSFLATKIQCENLFFTCIHAPALVNPSIPWQEAALGHLNSSKMWDFPFSESMEAPELRWKLLVFGQSGVELIQPNFQINKMVQMSVWPPAVSEHTEKRVEFGSAQHKRKFCPSWSKNPPLQQGRTSCVKSF